MMTLNELVAALVRHIEKSRMCAMGGDTFPLDFELRGAILNVLSLNNLGIVDKSILYTQDLVKQELMNIHEEQIKKANSEYGE